MKSGCYSFGMVQPGRNSNIPNYRYGFQGQERDDEIKGAGNSYDFGARMFDPRIGRWFSRDRYEKKYTGLSPYNFVANSPLLFIDKDGNDIWIFYENGQWEYKKTTKNFDDVGSLAGDKFYYVHDDGTVEDMKSAGNYTLGLIPGVDTPDQDINQEFNQRPAAWALYSKLNPHDTWYFSVMGFQSGFEAAVGVLEGVVGVVQIAGVAYRGGKAIYTLVKNGKTFSNVVAAGKSLKIGKITYKTGKAFMDVTAEEMDFLSYADELGEAVTVLERSTKTGVKNPDFLIKGNKWELKTIESITSKNPVKAIKNRMVEAFDQSGNIIVDLRNYDNFGIDDAKLAAKGAFKDSKKAIAIRVVGQNYDKTFYRASFKAGQPN